MAAVAALVAVAYRWIAEWIPNHLKPGVCELGGLVPFIGREADSGAAFASFALDAADAGLRVSVAGLEVGRTEAPNVEANLCWWPPHSAELSGSGPGDRAEASHPSPRSLFSRLCWPALAPRGRMGQPPSDCGEDLGYDL